MHSQLEAIVADLESAVARVHELYASFSHRAWGAQPAPGCWSPSECLAHLNLTSDALLPLVRTALQQGRERHEPSPARYRRNALGWFAWKVVSPMGGLKTRTSAPFVPVGALPVDRLVSDFTRLQTEIIACVREAEGLPLEHIMVRSPFHGHLTYNLYAALTLVPRHQHRHLHQAERAAQASVPLASPVAV